MPPAEPFDDAVTARLARLGLDQASIAALPRQLIAYLRELHADADATREGDAGDHQALRRLHRRRDALHAALQRVDTDRSSPGGPPPPARGR